MFVYFAAKFSDIRKVNFSFKETVLVSFFIAKKLQCVIVNQVLLTNMRLREKMITTLTKEDLIAFETEVAQLYLKEKIPGPIHLSYGNEEELIRIFDEISTIDSVFSTHRNHYHALLKGVPIDWLRTEILAGHSMTINYPDSHFYSSAVVADIATIALGRALALKRKESITQVWCFVGDMAAETGTVMECVKYAELQDLPITFIVEDNGLSVVTPTQETWGKTLLSTKKTIRYEYKNTRYPHAGVNKYYNGF